MSQGQVNTNIPITTTSKVMVMFPGDYAAADEGSFFVSTLASTASTAATQSTQSQADTNPALAINNGWTPGATNAMSLYLRYIKAVLTTVAGSNTSVNYSALVDNLQVKLTTTGTALGTPQNTNTNSGVLSKMSGYGGVNVAAAQTAQGRRVGAGQVTGAVGVAFDEWIFDFGPVAYGKNLIGTTSIVSARTVPMAPVILAPGWWFTLGFWGTAHPATADNYSWEIGFIERPAGQ